MKERCDKCKFWKKRGLKWTKVNEGWRLAEIDGTIHSCAMYQKVKVDRT